MFQELELSFPRKVNFITNFELQKCVKNVFKESLSLSSKKIMREYFVRVNWMTYKFSTNISRADLNFADKFANDKREPKHSGTTQLY